MPRRELRYCELHWKPGSPYAGEVWRMTETQKRELDAFLEEQKALGGVTPSQLSHGTNIWIHTDLYIYRATVDQNYDVAKFHVDSGDPNLPSLDRTCNGIGSYHQPLRYRMNDYLGFDLKLVLFFSDFIFTAGAIENITITGKTDQGEIYEYDLWQ